MSNGIKQATIADKVKSVGKKFWDLPESGIIIILVLYAAFVTMYSPKFMSVDNVMNFLRQGCYFLLAGLGMTLVLIAGGLDLSVGSIIAVSGVIIGLAIKEAGVSVPIAILLGLIAGAISGILNGSLVVRFKLPPMIMTLGMMYIARSIATVSTNGMTIYPLPESFNFIEQGELFNTVPLVLLYSLILSLVFHFILTRTTFGRSIYAVGGNRDTAKLSGIDVSKVTVKVYAICGIMAAFTGVIYTSRLGSANPGAANGFEMNVIAACIIGGTSTFGGKGTVLGTVLGAIFISMLTNSMTFMRVDVNFQKFAVGTVLVLAVILDQIKREIANKSSMNDKQLQKDEAGNE